MNLIRRCAITVLFLLGLIALSFPIRSVLAAAEDYPTKPIMLYYGMPPGATTGISGQIFADVMKNYLVKPQPVMVVSKPGAASMVCADYITKQPADGYTLFWNGAELPVSLITDPEKYSFTLEDFSFVGHVLYNPSVLWVRSQSPFKTFEEFVDYAKKHPGEMTVGTSGIVSPGHLALELMKKVVGINVIHVPFQGGAPATLAMLGGHVSAVSLSPGTLMTHLKAGSVRALTVFDVKRFHDLPDVPTCQEKGYNVVLRTPMWLAAKKGIPKPVLDTLIRLCKQTVNDPTLQSNYLRLGFVPLYMDPEETKKYAYEYGRLIVDLLEVKK